nr:hypothetical protein [Tanacetum cinerariifolium]
MARLSLTTRKRRQRRITFFNLMMTSVVFFVFSLWTLIVKYKRDQRRIRYSSSRMDRHSILDRYVYESDGVSISQIRMTQSCFKKLCDMLETYGKLSPSGSMDVDEQVAIFLHMCAHNVENGVMINHFQRSGERISKCFARVSNAVIRLHPRALDGTYIKCLVPPEDEPRYRTIINNEIATNVLGACSQDMQFIFVLVRWEGSATDGRVLRDALLRPHGLKVPRPCM